MFERLDRIPPTQFIDPSRGVSFASAVGAILATKISLSVSDICCPSSAPALVSTRRRGTMPSVQSFSIYCEALNEHGTFSEGDALRGKVTLALTKQINVESMFIKVTGDATVRWTKKVGDRSYTYSAEHRYFKLKQPLILGLAKGRW